jgi:hypothetical protein
MSPAIRIAPDAVTSNIPVVLPTSNVVPETTVKLPIPVCRPSTVEVSAGKSMEISIIILSPPHARVACISGFVSVAIKYSLYCR